MVFFPFPEFLVSEIQRLSAKVLTPTPSKGIPFPNIPGPKCKTHRIGIVGAGPSGIHMAYELKQRGFKNVRILEKSNRIGGKSTHVEHMGATYSLSTFIVTPEHTILMDLMKKFNLLDLVSEPFVPLLFLWLVGKRG